MWFPTMRHFGKCRLWRACAASFLAEKLQMMFCQGLNSHRIFKWLVKALIRLHVCAGWSEPLLVSHTTLLEISCHGSFVSWKMCLGLWFVNVYRILPVTVTVNVFKFWTLVALQNIFTITAGPDQKSPSGAVWSLSALLVFLTCILLKDMVRKKKTS